MHRPFDERAVLCDNRRAVKNFRSVVSPLVFGILLAVSGCEKSNDTPRLQDEARATAKEYQERFDELAHRAEAISKRGNTLRADPQSSAEAQRVYRQALTVLEDNRRFLLQVPASIDTSAKSADPDALPQLIDSLRERFEHAVIEVNAELDAVESWISVTEQQGSRAAAPPSPAGATVPAGDPQPVGSDAPVR
jgi:hypothetical protein